MEPSGHEQGELRVLGDTVLQPRLNPGNATCPHVAPTWLRLLAEKLKRAFGSDPTPPCQPPKVEPDPPPADRPKDLKVK